MLQAPLYATITGILFFNFTGKYYDYLLLSSVLLVLLILEEAFPDAFSAKSFTQRADK